MKKEIISKRKLKSIETKKKIYEAAKDLVIKYGIENVSVDSIVQAAGVSKGGFYVHFESKDALFTTLINDYTKVADLDYKSFLSTLSDKESIYDSLVQLAEEVSDFIEHSIGFDNMRALYKAHLSKNIDSTSAMSYNRELYKLFTELLERGVNQGEIREDIAIDLLAKHLIVAIRGLTFEWCIRYPDLSLKSEILDHFKILLYGLKK